MLRKIYVKRKIFINMFKNVDEINEDIPIQYLEGKVNFMGMDISVNDSVLIPRPETELLVKVVLNVLEKKNNNFVLDMCTGSGNIAIALAKSLSSSKIIGVDICEKAIELAKQNASNLKILENINFVVSDMFMNFDNTYNGKFSCIVSNPPYVSDVDYEKVDKWVKCEPKIALYGGEEGMHYLNILAKKSMLFLSDNGFLTLEIGYDQTDKVKNILKEIGYKNITSYKDFNDYERVIVGYKNG